MLKVLLWITAAPDGYDSKTWTLFWYVALEFEISWRQVIGQETLLGKHLYAQEDDKEGDKVACKSSTSLWTRHIKIGQAAVTGATLLAVTGGLAAPAIAAGFSTLGGAGVVIGTAVASATGIAATTVVFGAAGAGLARYKFDRRTQALSLFRFDLMYDMYLWMARG